MKTIGRTLEVLTAIFLFLVVAHTAYSQEDPPDRVARLNYIQGAVSYLPSGGSQDDWVGAVLNRPLTTGDRLWADANSRAELHIGPNAIRIDSNTGISFLNLDDANVQIRLSDGSMIVRLRQLDPDNTFEVDMPNLAFPVRRPGDYRFDTHPDTNTTVVTVRQGEGDAVGGGRSWQVISDQQAFFIGTDVLSYDLKDADSQPLTDFDRWAAKRDEKEDRVASVKYVSPEMTGYEDLDAFGTWTNVTPYGWCWAPAGIPVGWAPYRFGHWVYIVPWGWTWVDDEPWGFAPFHYGRWAYWHTGWMWVPGPIVRRPCYAPALVVWVGGGMSSFSFSAGIGRGIGWFPLGPREVYVPPYRVTQGYVTRINVTNTVVSRSTVINFYQNRNVKNLTYINRAAPNAVTVVPHDAFVTARPVMRSIVNVPARELEAAPVTREISVAPERASVYGAGPRNAPHPPAAIMDHPVVASRTPPRAPDNFAPVQSTPAYRPSSRASSPGTRATAPAGTGASIDRPESSSRPSVRPAPPVRTPTPQEQKNMQSKQRAWENAHPRNKPPAQRGGGAKAAKPSKHE